jgi:hypothetical protein
MKRNPRAPRCFKYQTVPDIYLLALYPTENLKKVYKFQIIHNNTHILFREPIDLVGVDIDKAVTLDNDIFELDRNMIKTKKHAILVTHRNFRNYKEHLAIGKDLKEYNNELKQFTKGKSVKMFDESNGSLKIRY